MRLMILSTLALAGLAAGIVWCPPIRNRMATVVFGDNAKVSQTASKEALSAQMKEGAVSALHHVEATAAHLIGSTAKTSPAPTVRPVDDVTTPPAPAPVQGKG